jgi:hypothetical protein
VDFVDEVDPVDEFLGRDAQATIGDPRGGVERSGTRRLATYTAFSTAKSENVQEVPGDTLPSGNKIFGGWEGRFCEKWNKKAANKG